MAGEPPLDSSRKRFTGEQKIGIGLLLIFAVVSVSLGALQIRNQLYKPFALNNSVPGGLKEQIETLEALRYRDTDFDGLNDFDESYQFNTSPYLADTDSDGLDDKTEVLQGTNPLCAKDKQCELEEENTDTALVKNEIDPGAFGLDGAAPTDVNTLLRDPKYIRQLLVQNGLQKSLVDKMSDKELLAMINQVLQTTTSSIPR